MITFKPVIRSHVRQDGTTNIKIRVCKDKEARYISTRFYTHPYNFNKKLGIVNIPAPDQEDVNLELHSLISTYKKKVNENWDKLKYMPIWDIVDFLSEKRDYGDVISILSSMSEEKKEQGNINYSISINSTISAIKDFTGKENLPIQVVTPAWLKDFETKLLTKGGSKGNRKTRTKMSVNGAGVYMRNIRTAYNLAIRAGMADHNSYPFRNFSIKRGKTRHRVVSAEDINAMINYAPETFHEGFARDMFLLSFYLIGINMADMFKLTKIYNDGRVKYQRSKGKHEFDILAQPEALEIINRHMGKKFLLDVLERYSDYRAACKTINTNLKKIADKLDMGVPLTTYYVRHTWATIASSLDVHDNTISWALGHIRNPMTRIYNMFENKKVDAANRQVIDAVRNIR
ncbi:MAG TPA: hypothetical protein GXZ49_08020 [Bacteroidetes bacterium]|nr:hypothetical protein [Bacteroidota bacterium]